jgi:hypothetical protein
VTHGAIFIDAQVLKGVDPEAVTSKITPPLHTRKVLSSSLGTEIVYPKLGGVRVFLQILQTGQYLKIGHNRFFTHLFHNSSLINITSFAAIRCMYDEVLSGYQPGQMVEL